jgi:hypothetical protein
MPFMMTWFQPADVANRMLAARCPERQVSGAGQAADDSRVNCFLKNNKVRRRSANYFREFPFATSTTEADVIAE